MRRQNGFENHRLRTLIWIIKQLKKYRHLSLKELNELWTDDRDLSGGMEIGRRTFLNHINAIRDLFNIWIECKRSDEYRYYIDDAGMSPVVGKIIENFEQNMALGNGIDMQDRILIDEAPEGKDWLEIIIASMKSGHNVSFTFCDFHDEVGEFEVVGSPYCVKLYQQRWYVLIKHLEDGFLDTYCLDRITDLKQEKSRFKMEKGFDTEKFFKFSFGVRVNQDDAPSIIKLKVLPQQCKYLRTLPLHESQEEIETTPEYSIFTLEIVPTIEFTMKILSYGFLVEVLEPQFCRDVIANEVKKMNKMYK